jgi:hypothetical protein
MWTPERQGIGEDFEPRRSSIFSRNARRWGPRFTRLSSLVDAGVGPPILFGFAAIAAVHGAGRGALSPARTRLRFPVHAAGRLRVRAAELPHDAPALEERQPYWQVGLGYALLGIGVGLFGTPASHSLTASVPVGRVGMASGTADLQRDLGGAIMQSIFGALLTAGYAATVAAAPNKAQITASTQNQLEKSFSSATAVAHQYPQYAGAITTGAKTSFLQGANWAYAAGVIATIIGIALVFFLFPRKDEEQRLLSEYRVADSGRQRPSGRRRYRNKEPGLHCDFSDRTVPA